VLVLALHSEKGGVAKTSTVTGMAAVAGERGIRVVVVDGDPRATATQELGIADTSQILTLNDLLFVDPRADDPPDPADVIGDVLHQAGPEWPGTVRVICAERNLANREADAGPMEYRLRRALAALTDADLVLCDLPPRAGGRLTTTLLTAADLVMYPATLQIDGYEGVREAHRTMRLIRQGPNPGLREMGIVRTIVPRPRDRRLIHDQIDRLLAETFPDQLLATQIYHYAVREETRYASWPITAASGRAAAALSAAYGVLVDQVMEAA
jgi:chromosome partitioning protein